MKLFYRYSFLLISAVLVIFEIILILKGQWSGDFWEHSAVVCELSSNLAHPGNPIINLNIPHAFFSPFSVLVALFSRITSLNSILSLQYFAFFNLLFFLSMFYFFVKVFFENNYILVSTLSLLFILLFWGETPYSWSGFYHLFVLELVLPYPSTFAMSLTFLILSLIKIELLNSNLTRGILIIILSAIVFITHPPTAIFLFLGIFALIFTFNQQSSRQSALECGKIIVPTLLLCLCWPYFNIVDLFTSNTQDFHIDSYNLYANVSRICWPILLIIPGIIYVKSDKLIRFLFVLVILTLILYMFGFVFRVYGFSRLIANSMMMAQFLVAYLVAIASRKLDLFAKLYVSLIIISLLSCVYLNRYSLIKKVNVFGTTNKDYYMKYDFLRSHLESDKLILSDPKSNWFIPSFNGKVISSKHPLYWVSDINERRSAVHSFFTRGSSNVLREGIIQKYQPDYILINHSEIDFNVSTQKWLNSLGETTYKSDQLELIEIRK
jgi:hypothetical protein